MNKLPDYQRMSAVELCETLTTVVGGPLACQASDRIQGLYAQLEMRGDCKLPVGNDLEIFGKVQAIEQVRGLIVQFQSLQTENQALKEGKIACEEALSAAGERCKNLEDEVKRLTAEQPNPAAIQKAYIEDAMVKSFPGPTGEEVPHVSV